MTIDWIHFTPLQALAGGALIGLATALLLLADGRILGASGIFAGLLSPGGDFPWRLAFLAGLVVAGPFGVRWFGLAPAQIPGAPALLTVAGLLVGVGTGLANGCTTGHGICGLARLSPRSLAATAAFMAAGFLSASLLRHWWG